VAVATEKINWTAQQKLAINSTGRDVLVTASAGTGKTAVLAERCANLLADTDNPTDISQILVLTFTNAAADQMQSRIAESLRAWFVKNRSSYLRRQLLRLDAAHISTIHTFCKRIITDNFHRLGIDPTFRIIEEDEQGLLKFEILNEIIEEAWQDSALAAGLNQLLHCRNIQSISSIFLDKIITCSQFLDSVAGRTDWYARAMALAEATGLYTTTLAQKQKQIILNKLARCKSQLEYAQLLDTKLTPNGHWTSRIQQDFLEPISKCIEHLQKDDIDRCVETIRNFTRPKFINKPKDMPPDIAGLIKAPALKAIKTFQGLLDLALINPDYEQIVAPSAGLQTRVMIELVKRFDRACAEAKAKLNCLDFADLEHLMLKLLTDSDSTATALSEKFKFIFVDEYQDINPVQQAILDKISRPDNIFVVGDIKQSIYAFRQAQPEIFLKRLQQTTESDARENLPVRVDLSGNFRSRKGILDFANTVFSRIMTAPAFLVDYDEKTFLRPQLDYKPISEITTGQCPLVEMYILNEETPGDDNDNSQQQPDDTRTDIISSTQRQAAFIAGRISQMVGTETGCAEFKIYDKKNSRYRDVEYRDIVILMRSLAHRANEYVEVLRLAGIPVSCQSQAGYFAATEITDCVSLLKVLDNPQQDIELAAVLRSAFFKVTDTELAMLRKHGNSINAQIRLSFYDCIDRYSKNGPDPRLREKLGDVLAQIDQWRLQARRQPLAELLWQIYRQTGYLSFVSAQPNGTQRRANLLKLHERAIQFEGFVSGAQTTSLARFVEFIEKLLERGRDWAPAEPDNLTENAVRIMSVHKSKGLEFPVVFLAELNRPFNKKDCYGDCLIDDTYGIGLQIIEPQSNVKLNTIAHEVIAEKKLDTMLAEEMRILYVAMTRAREKLVLTASRNQKDCSDILAACSALPDEPVRDWQLKSAKCHFDWILYALANHKKLNDLFKTASRENAVDENLFSTQLLDRNVLDEISAEILKKKHSKLTPRTPKISKRGELLLAKIKNSLDRQYPFADLTKLPAKTSVSELTHRDDEFAKADFTDALQRLPKAVLTETAIDRKLIGTATHLVIQNLAFDSDITFTSIRATAEKLVSEDKISAEVAQQINLDSVLEFFQTEPGKLVLEHKDDILQEWPFTFALGTARLGAKPPGETVIVQGIIDMIVKTPAGLVIIDFKTDDVTAESACRRAKLYLDQINLYATAASAILKEKIVGSWLYFLKPATAVNTRN